MGDENNEQPPKKSAISANFTPSASTGASAIGGMFAVILIKTCIVFGITFDAGDTVMIGSGMAVVAGYFFSGGRRIDTQ